MCLVSCFCLWVSDPQIYLARENLLSDLLSFHGICLLCQDLWLQGKPGVVHSFGLQLCLMALPQVSASQTHWLPLRESN